uniref:tRNA (guanine(26)-N(2))-dimethyltransferase n=1 Tax=Tarenaya spinosa TaxID=228870 RepID=Q1KUP9_9ROSI|nr:hypothetical protein [Tarenaya spinosa]
METDLSDYTVIKEGEAEILMHKKNQVFFNKAQIIGFEVNNRDMSIAVLRAFISKRKQEHEAMLSKRNRSAGKVLDKDASESATGEAPCEKNNMNNGKTNGEHEVAPEDGPSSASKEPSKAVEETGRRELKPPRVLEALSASGLRALRYAREVEGIGQVVALDNDQGNGIHGLYTIGIFLLKASVEACRRNIKFNGSVVSSKVESHHTDARVYMLTHPKEFDMVDLDPYGSPSIFLDSAVQSVVDGGLLMCTATDMAVLCGGNGESHANRYKRYIVPVLSVQMDFYVRVFVRVYTSASAMKNTPLKLSYVYQCTGCDSFHLQTVGRSLPKNNSVRYLPAIGPVVPQDCIHCGKKYNMGGPIWSAPIHDQEWVASILNGITRCSSVLSLHNLCGTLKCTSPSAAMFRSAVINAKYRISGTHVNPLGLKTDAPMEVIWDIMRCWVKNHPVKAQSPDQPGSVILSKEPSHQVGLSLSLGWRFTEAEKADFSRQVGSLSKAQAKKVARFLPNPEKHWGPKVRAGRLITSKHISLLGPEAVNGHLHHDQEEEEEDKDQEERDPKRQKTTEDLSSTS